uniref:MoaD/ThiS family protein n=1 Tax=Geoglobus ahangari TaxID=113653 RepID=A0A7C3UKJ6_9EURY
MRSQEKSYQKKIKIKFTFLGGFEFKEKEVEVEEGKKYSEILEDLGINPETVVLVKEKPIPIDEIATEGEVKVLRVISGG